MANSKELQNNIYSRVQNPYNNLDSSSQLSGFQKFLDKIGLTNYAGKLAYQQQLASNQWQSEFDAAQSDILYNSPQNQAELMSAAGLNSDLLGVNNFEADSANSMNTPSQQLQSEIDEPLNKIFMGLFNGIKTAVGLREGLLNINSLKLDNDSKSVKTLGEFMDIFDRINVKGASVSNLGYSFLTTIKNRKFRRQLKRTLDEMFTDPNSVAPKNYMLEQENKYLQNQENVAKQLSSPYRSEKDPWDMNSMVSNLRDVNKLELDLYKIKLETDKLVSDLQGKSAEYQTDIASFKSSADYKKTIEQFQKRVHEVLGNFFEKKIGSNNMFDILMLNSMLAGATGSLDPVSSGLNIGGNILKLIP